MKRKRWILLFLMAVILALSACGTKSQEDVRKALDSKISDVKSYKAEAEMTLKVGNEPQSYHIEIWYQKPEKYRVLLKNADKKQSQMILRNKEGVYVLTPALNKSYRFQSDWPHNSSQAYLYGSLIKDILEDKEAKFTATKEHYEFETKTRYQNSNMLPMQKITFSKKKLAPKKVVVMDTDRKEIMTVKFSKFTFDPDFDKDAFEMKKNMTGAQLAVPVNVDKDQNDFTIMYPTVEIEGTSLIEKDEQDTGNGMRVVLSYGGEKSFTLIQEKATIVPASITETEMTGDLADLGFTVGAITDHSLSWTNDGVEYMLASNDLSKEEMIEIARSVYGTDTK